MDISTIFAGLVLLIIAWAVWTYAVMIPDFIRVILAAVIGLVGLYLLIVGVLAGSDASAAVLLVR